MSDHFTESGFQPCINGVFRAKAGATTLDLVLAEVHSLPRSPNAPRAEPFSLIFLGPPKPILRQATYTLTHETLGALDIFIVPVGPDPRGGMQYEAVFN